MDYEVKAHEFPEIGVGVAHLVREVGCEVEARVSFRDLTVLNNYY